MLWLIGQDQFSTNMGFTALHTTHFHSQRTVSLRKLLHLAKEFPNLRRTDTIDCSIKK